MLYSTMQNEDRQFYLRHSKTTNFEDLQDLRLNFELQYMLAQNNHGSIVSIGVLFLMTEAQGQGLTGPKN